MASKASNLSDPRCQCDFVVATTTQASINAGLLEYLDKATQPLQYVCVVHDKRNKSNPSQMVSLDDLLTKTGGVNPFEMPDRLDENDPRDSCQSQVSYGGDVADWNSAGTHASDPSPYRHSEDANFWVYKQPEAPAEPWSMSMWVNLNVATVDERLESLQADEHTKNELQKALVNLSGTVFSLQQLYFNLDSAVMETVPEFEGVGDLEAKNLLKSYHRGLYVKSARENWLPLVAVTAVEQPEDKSTLHLTGFERIVSPLKDSNGMPIQSPSPSEEDVTTLDHLCAINGHAVPRIAGLDWNWMKPEDVNNSSGVIAIDRNILANFIASNCNLADFSYAPSGESDTIYLETTYRHADSVPDSGRQTISSGSFTKVTVNTSLDVYFEERSIRVVQSSLVNVTCALASNDTIDFANQTSVNIVNKSLTDIYSMSSESIPASGGNVDINDPASLIRALYNSMVGGEVLKRLEKAREDIDRAGGGLHELPLSNLQNFVFPGGRVFTYKDPSFSYYQDLVCKITYLEPSKDPLSFMSYTTTIQVSEIDRELPVPNSLVNLSAISRTPVYINGLYYVLSAIPIQVATDHTGSLTIVEATEDLHAAILTVSLDNTAITINAMDNTFIKLTALDTAEKLPGARVLSQIFAGGTVRSPETEAVIGSSVSDDDADAVAANMALLQRAYAKIRKQDTGEVASAGPAVRPVNFRVLGDIEKLGDDAIHGRFGDLPDDVGDIVKDGADEARSLADDFGKALESFGDVISESAGNVLQWVKHGGEVIGRIVYDTVTKTVHFIAKVGKQIYHAVLDTVHAIVAAAEWVYQKIKTLIETIIKFLQMLFEWDDIRRTKNVMLKLTKLRLQGQVDNLPRTRQELDKAVSEVEKKTNEWANITGGSTLTLGSRFLVDKYRYHAHQLEIVGDMPAMDLLETLLVELLTAISKDAQTLGAVFTQLQTLVSEFHSLSVEEILKRLVAIIVDETLSSLQVVLDGVLNILFEISQTALSVLDTKIRIPVISWILKKIGVPEISFLDLFSWIGGFAVTVIYKTTEGEAPFPKGDSTVEDIESASGWGEIPALFSKQHAALGASVSSSAIPSFAARHEGTVPIALSAKKPVFVSCHLFSTVLAFVGSPITALEAEDPRRVLGHPRDRRPGNQVCRLPETSSTTVGILIKIMFSGPFQKLFTKVEGKLQGRWPKFSFGKMLIKNCRGVGAFLSAFLCIYHLPPTIWHFYKLSKKPNDLTKAASITAEVSALAADILTIAYAFAVNDDEEDSRQVAIGITVAANSLYVALQVAEVGLGTSEL
ncbi:hypothetical protein BJX62DRAFT_242151 [Aspergillus germanicus]